MRDFNVTFDNEGGSGILDIAIRFNMVNGAYEMVLEENGLPIYEAPFYQIAGILQAVMLESFQNASAKDEE